MHFRAELIKATLSPPPPTDPRRARVLFPGKEPGVQDRCDTKLVLASRDGKVVGKGVRHHPHARGAETGRSPGAVRVVRMRATHAQVAAAMLGYLESWFVREGCREMTGPHGFSDLDPEGMLIEGFGALPTIGGSYHKPYYRNLV